MPGAQITRLRAALTSPLGALGDQLFWAGVVPAAMGLAIPGCGRRGRAGSHHHGAGPLQSAPHRHRCVGARKTGLAHGMKVGAAMGESSAAPVHHAVRSAG